jgi:hypothetical protein
MQLVITLNTAEFKAILEDPEKLRRATKLIFDKFDANRFGQIEKSELKPLL